MARYDWAPPPERRDPALEWLELSGAVVRVHKQIGQIVVLGRPADLPNPEDHDCDLMGCGSAGLHTLARWTP